MPQSDIAKPNCILVAGANGGIGAALCRELTQRFPQATLLTISRRECTRLSQTQRHLTAELSVPDSVSQISQWLGGLPLPNWVINCCGTLHWQGHRPEKSLQQCDDHALQQSFTRNVFTHLHLAQAMAPLLQKRSPFVWVSLSAKVGSIQDNRLGGWYSYRMSKAALNMLVRNLSIEWGRKLDSCFVVAMHPGTTDTSLSRPFQENIPPEKLYSAPQSAERIVQVIQRLQEGDSGKLLFWNGEHLPW